MRSTGEAHGIDPGTGGGRRVLGLIEAFLKQGVIAGMQSWEAESGTPQGAVISPLLANIYLDPLDWFMAEAGLELESRMR